MHTDRITAIEAFAATQYHLFTDVQAATVGVGPDMLEWHARQGGRWRRWAPRVYGLRFTWDDVVRHPHTTGRITLAAVASSHRIAV